MKCPRCGGSGTVTNPAAIGALFRRLRAEKGQSLRSVAQRIGISAAYLSDLELGRRGWNEKVRKRVARALGVSHV